MPPASNGHASLMTVLVSVLCVLLGLLIIHVTVPALATETTCIVTRQEIREERIDHKKYYELEVFFTRIERYVVESNYVAKDNWSTSAKLIDIQAMFNANSTHPCLYVLDYTVIQGPDSNMQEDLVWEITIVYVFWVLALFICTVLVALLAMMMKQTKI